MLLGTIEQKSYLATAVVDRLGHVHDLQDHILLPACLCEAA